MTKGKKLTAAERVEAIKKKKIYQQKVQHAYREKKRREKIRKLEGRLPALPECSRNWPDSLKQLVRKGRAGEFHPKRKYGVTDAEN